MKRALVYDPYLDTLGGGERYTLTFAQVLKHLDFEVKLAWSDEQDLTKAKARFGIDMSGIEVDPTLHRLCASRSSLSDRFKFTKKFDLVFWVSDGSLPFLFGKKNLVHFQVPFSIPFNQIGGSPLIRSLKLLFINKLVYNSAFTRSVIERSFPRSKGVILYPPIDTDQFVQGKKENLILSVARFDSPSHSKRQDVLIDAFRELFTEEKGYRLVLVGGHRGGAEVLNSLKQRAGDLPVEIIPNPDFIKLKDLYSKARFFWHAAGYGIDEIREPEKVEHFGMTTVEAMSAGCIPIVISKGGQKEIITPDSGFLVETPGEISKTTMSLIQKKNFDKYSKNAIKRAEVYSISNFSKNIEKIIS
ncbi:MAG: Glycosyl transferase [Candidatus Shapirobacteria bacterium GW2011_GWE1_38_10]|uniref:Glycosyl transferase n=1 Tax=Candidatus Shapirobacteria bacterium GW2011_GWE1_38_10 TaxID=1618488 RepID=A0A0G0KHQ5_9BACT|nr:MAG: Glycosyl transferase [Candidatus Shapirobacteria bacterium GW2011_GWE1_38_10]